MIRHDLVGRTVTVVEAENPSLAGITGEVVDETKQTLRVRTDRGEKTLLKEQITIEVDGVRIEGRLLTQRPEKRTKLRITKWQRRKPQPK